MDVDHEGEFLWLMKSWTGPMNRHDIEGVYDRLAGKCMVGDQTNE